jgi:hypothetical protein
MVTPILGFDGIQQLDRVKAGDPAQTNREFMNLVRSRLQGSALGSLLGLETLLRDYARGDLKDISTIFSTDVINFRRRVRRAAADIWVIGIKEVEYVETITTAGPDTSVIPLSKQPALALVQCTVNGSSVAATMIQDVDDATRGSTQAQTYIQLAASVPDGSVVVIRYLYNELIERLQAYTDSRSTVSQPASVAFRRAPRLYDLDARIRQAIPVTIGVTVALTVLSSYDDNSAQTAAIQSILSEINSDRFDSQVLPETVRTQIAASVVGVSAISMLRFQRVDRPGLLVDAVELRPYEYTVTSSPDNIVVYVRRS